eukprot:scaffold20768_cov138-Skeletonema_dohrnii-CCMP3373.AAC.5
MASVTIGHRPRLLTAVCATYKTSFWPAGSYSRASTSIPRPIANIIGQHTRRQVGQRAQQHWPPPRYVLYSFYGTQMTITYREQVVSLSTMKYRNSVGFQPSGLNFEMALDFDGASTGRPQKQRLCVTIYASHSLMLLYP